MTEPKVTALAGAEIGVPDAAAAVRFYTDIWGLTQVATHDGATYLRGTGAPHHILVVHERPAGELVRANFSAADKDAVDGLCAKAKGLGLPIIAEPAPLATPGGGYGFTFLDREERVIGIDAGVAVHADTADAPDKPRYLSHFVFNAADADACSDLFIDLLGFKLSDQTRMFNFLRCNEVHHSISFAYADASTLNHIAFDMPDWEAVMLGSGRMRDHDYEIEWGVGRHGPGNNVFAYFVGPGGFPIEYTAEVDRIDESYKVGRPDDWKWPPGRLDRWGITAPPSERLKQAQTQIGFARAEAVSA